MLAGEQNRKSDIDSFGNELNFSLESNSNSFDNSQLKFTNSGINNNNQKKDDLPVISISREEENKNGIPKNNKTFKSFVRKYSKEDNKKIEETINEGDKWKRKRKDMIPAKLKNKRSSFNHRNNTNIININNQINK